MKYVLYSLIFISTLFAQDFKIMPLKTDSFEATLIYKTLFKSKKAILYIHGFNDYFWNKELAQKFLDEGYSFFAIDLHNHGKNLKPKHKPYYFKDIREFDDEISLAIKHIKNDFDILDLTLYGYSQGGLVAVLYANEYKNVNRIILDSPFFDLYFSYWVENFALPVVAFIGKFIPTFKIALKQPNIFGQTLHKDFQGEWDFDTNLKSIKIHAPIYLGWISAIYEAQQRVHAKLDLNIPVLSLYSNLSSKETSSEKILFYSDIVLDVNDMQKYSNYLNVNPSLTTHKVIENAMHGVTLSHRNVRAKAYKSIFQWLKKTN